MPSILLTLVPRLTAMQSREQHLYQPSKAMPTILTLQFKYTFLLEDESAPKQVLDQVLDANIPVPVKDLFMVSPEFWKYFCDLTTTKRIPNHPPVQVNELASLDPVAIEREYDS